MMILLKIHHIMIFVLNVDGVTIQIMKTKERKEMKNNLFMAVCISTNKLNTLEVGEYYYIKNEFIYNNESYVEVLNPNKILVGIFKRNHFAVLKTEAQAKEILRDLKGMNPNMETLYEDVIVSAVGEEGLYALRSHHLIETCGTFNGRKLYAI